MANLTWLNGGIDRMASLVLNRATVGNLWFRLFVNEHEPVVTDTHAAFDVCTLAGYDDRELLFNLWSGGVDSGVATYRYPALTFVFEPYAGGTSVYGVVLETPLGTSLAACELGSPYEVPAGGGSLTLTPRLRWQQCP